MTNFPAAGFRSQAIYPNAVDGTYFETIYDYEPIVKSFGDVLVQVDDEDYSGDTRVLLHKDGRYGFLNFGWGSCSGCDTLQACSSYKEIDVLIEELENNIKWFDTLTEATAYIINDQERQGSYYYHENEWAQFKASVQKCGAQ
jgi:hypothetical protein